MKCDNCQNREATFFYEENLNGKKRSLHLCPECAAKMQGSKPFGEGVDFPFPVFSDLKSDFLNGLFGLSPSAVGEGRKTCRGCGAAWSDLRKAGKAFCPECYATFGEELAPTLRSLHGNVTHTGRAPADRREARAKQDRLAALKAQLSAAIAEENFEQAAKLRDEIRQMERE